jgi:hypothetical protein
LAGEGSAGERGRSPLSNSLPLLNNLIKRLFLIKLFERGIKGMSIKKLNKFKNTE